MASTTIKVTSATITSKNNELKSLNSKLSSELSSMDSTEKSLLSMWEGDASNAFDKNYQTDMTKMQNLQKAVQNYCTALDQIVSQYEKSEKKNIATAQKRS